MSWETEEWARKQRVGDPVRKAILVAIANEADSSGCNAFPSIRYVAFSVEVSERTVQRRIQELEEMQLLRRVRRHRPDGSQSSNGYDLIGYEPPLQWRDRPRREPRRGGDNLTPPGAILTGEDDASGTGPGDTAVTPKTSYDLPFPPTADERSSAAAPPGEPPSGDEKPDEGKAPKSRRGARLPEDWTPPPVETLPQTVQAVISQWPKGAYDFVGTGFAAHWTAETSARASKSNWRAAWIKWLTSEGPRVMSMAKAGIKFLTETKAVTETDHADVLRLQETEGPEAKKIRVRLQKDIDERTYVGWLLPTSIGVDKNGFGWMVNVVTPSKFMSDWVQQNFGTTIRAAACAVLETADVRLTFDDVTDR